MCSRTPGTIRRRHPGRGTDQLGGSVRRRFTRASDREFWQRSAPLAQMLRLMRMSGAFSALSELAAPWGLAMPALEDTTRFHCVTDIRCALEVEGVAPRSRWTGSGRHPGSWRTS